MNEEIILMSNYLRNEGMFVSIRSTLLACEIFNDLKDKLTFDELYNSLKVIYVKDIADEDKFDRVFNKIFKKVEIESNDMDTYQNKLNQPIGENESENITDLDELIEYISKIISLQYYKGLFIE